MATVTDKHDSDTSQNKPNIADFSKEKLPSDAKTTQSYNKKTWRPNTAEQDWIEKQRLDSRIDKRLFEANCQWREGYYGLGLFLSECDFGNKKITNNNGTLTAEMKKQYNYLMDGYLEIKTIDPLTKSVKMAQVKAFSPQKYYKQGKNGTIQEHINKYVTPTGRNSIYIYPILPNHIFKRILRKQKVAYPSQELNEYQKWEYIRRHCKLVIISEGWKKCLSLLTQGIPAIACNSSTTHSVKKTTEESAFFTQLRPELLWLFEEGLESGEQREIAIAFDFDEKTKTQIAVGRQKKYLGTKIQRQGQKVSILDWGHYRDKNNGSTTLTNHGSTTLTNHGSMTLTSHDKCPKGIDDFIAEYGAKGLDAIMENRTPFVQFCARIRALAGRKLTYDKKINQQYIDSSLIEAAKLSGKKLIAIQSPQRTNKTGALADFLAKGQQQGETTCSIVHRQALAKDQSERLGIGCYLDTNPDINLNNAFGLTICVDSIMKINPSEQIFDNLVLDECEQLMWHSLTSTTDIRIGRNDKIAQFGLIGALTIANEGFIILLDADLTDYSIDFCCHLFNLKKDDVLVVKNEYKPFTNRDIYFIPSKEAIRYEILKQIEEGKRILIHTSSQKVTSGNSPINIKTDVLGDRHRTVEDCLQIKFENKKIKVLDIDRETIADKTHPAYRVIDNPETLKDFDVVICSPVIDTGVNLTVERVGDFDAVFGIYFGFYPLETFEQQIERYRGDCDRFVYVPRYSNCSINCNTWNTKEWCKWFDTRIEEIVNPFLETDVLQNQYSYLKELTGRIACRINGDYKNIRDNLKFRLINKGYNLKYVEDLTPSGKKQIRERVKEIKEVLIADTVAEVSLTPNPHPEEYKTIKKKKVKTRNERMIETRGDCLYHFGAENITDNLIEAEVRALYPKLRLRFWLNMGVEATKKRDKRTLKKYLEDNPNPFFRDIAMLPSADKVWLLSVLNLEKYIKADRLCVDDLEEFGNLCREKLSQAIFQVFGIKVRNQDNTTLFKAMIKRLGYEWEKLERRGQRGQEKRYYRVVDPVKSEWANIFSFWLEQEETLSLLHGESA